MYGDDGDNDTSWMNESATPPAQKPKPKQQNSWANDPKPQINGQNDTFGTSNTFQEEDNNPEFTEENNNTNGGGWSDVASSRYQGSNEPDWMQSSSKRNANANKKAAKSTNSVPHEFGSNNFRQEEVRFAGDDGKGKQKQARFDGDDDAINNGGNLETSLLSNKKKKASNKRGAIQGRRRGEDEDGGDVCGQCCQSSWSVCTVLILILCGIGSLLLFIISLMQEFNMQPNIIGGFIPGKNHSVSTFLRSDSSFDATVDPCLTSTCLKSDSQYKKCAFQYQYISSNGVKKCGSSNCRASNGFAPNGWSFPVAFSCPDFPNGQSFSCGWEYMTMLWRVLSTCGGCVAVMLYLWVIKRCRSCVGCSLWLINILMFGHGVLSLICMIQDSIAVAAAQAFCTAGLKIPNGGASPVNVCDLRAPSAKGGSPSCIMFQYIFVCLVDAGLGLLWFFAGYSMCKSRAARNAK